ncbi:MAG: SDR family oxidoreductase [Dehalococcoidales bacterium]|nr:SDR family oxidoreductase [Dehalococcoidales bacterium]
MQLEGKTAVITGGGIGIGRAIALRFAQEGADIVLAAESESPLKEVAAEIEKLDRKALVVVMDLLDQTSPEMMINKALDTFGKIDILVNNSGSEGPIMPVSGMDLDGWNDLLSVNLTGAMLCSRYALERSMIPRESGVIINMASAAGRKGLPSRSPYSSSKFAIIGFTQSLATEVGCHGIRVNAIAPGAVEGDRIRRIFEQSAKNMGLAYEDIVKGSNSRSALGRMVQPEEVAALALFLSTEQSSAITGQTINIDAGSNYN